MRDIEKELGYIRYESISQYFRATPTLIDGNKDDWTKITARRWGAYGCGSNWYGVNSKKEIYNLQRDGWKDGIARLTAFSKKIKSQLPVVRRTRKKKHWGNVGGFVDLGQLMKGRTQTAWIRSENTAGPKMKNKAPIVPVIIQVGGNCNLTADQLFWGPAAGLVLCEILQALKYSVEISTLTSVLGLPGYNAFQSQEKREAFRETFNDSYSFRVIVKQPHLSLSTRSLSIVACGAYFRWYGFKALYCAPFQCSYNLGRHNDYPEVNDRRDKMKPVLITSIYNETSAVTFLNHVVQDFMNEDD